MSAKNHENWLTYVKVMSEDKVGSFSRHSVFFPRYLWYAFVDFLQTFVSTTNYAKGPSE